MRLIDADRTRKNLLMMECMEDVVEVIDNEPTAYDIDKVVQQLEEKCISPNDYPGYVVDLELAIEIVKAGGKNEMDR